MQPKCVTISNRAMSSGLCLPGLVRLFSRRRHIQGLLSAQKRYMVSAEARDFSASAADYENVPEQHVLVSEAKDVQEDSGIPVNRLSRCSTFGDYVTLCTGSNMCCVKQLLGCKALSTAMSVH